MKRVAGALLLLGVFACTASAAGPVRVSLTGKRAAPVAGRAWTVRLAVRPRSYAGAVRVTAVGPGRVRVRATGQARLVSRAARLPEGRAVADHARRRAARRRGSDPFACAGRRPGPSSSPSRPRSTSSPTGTLLLVENNPGRVLRVNPADRARAACSCPSIARPYAVVRAPSGSVYVSVGNQLQRLNGGGPPTTVAEVPAGVEIGPIAAGAERRCLLLDRDADLPAPGRFRAAHPDRRHRGGRRRR